jgi:signal peptidase I
LSAPLERPAGAQSNRPSSLVADLLEVVVFALILWFFISNVVQPVRVQGHSMDDSLHDGDLLISSKLSYRLGSPHVGDIIILRDPGDPQLDFIKRVVATPGTEIWVQNAHVCVRIPPGSGPVFTLVEPHVKQPWLSGVDSAPRVLGPDQFYVMGDNRSDSTDSRVFGPLARSAILGQAWIRLWPLDSLGVVGTRTQAVTPPAGVCSGVH